MAAWPWSQHAAARLDWYQQSEPTARSSGHSRAVLRPRDSSRTFDRENRVRPADQEQTRTKEAKIAVRGRHPRWPAARFRTEYNDDDAAFFAALERLERRMAASIAKARESVVALEYTAPDAPSGTRRIARGGDQPPRRGTFGRIDQPPGAQDPPRATCLIWRAIFRADVTLSTGWRPTPRPD